MSAKSRKLAGLLLVLLPTVVVGGANLVRLLTKDPTYAANPLRQDLWRAAHAHAGILLLLSLIALRYVDEALLPPGMKSFARFSIPGAAILLPSAFFLSVLPPDVTAPNGFINLAYVAAVLLAAGTLTLGLGLMRTPRQKRN